MQIFTDFYLLLESYVYFVNAHNISIQYNSSTKTLEAG
jgi:hypothetical protein